MNWTERLVGISGLQQRHARGQEGAFQKILEATASGWECGPPPRLRFPTPQIAYRMKQPSC